MGANANNSDDGGQAAGDSSSAAPLFLGASVQLRKPHACGGFDWTVTRIGADIGLCCRQCDRRILLPRAEFERRLRRRSAADTPAV